MRCIAPVRMSMAQMKEAAGLGAYLEFVYNALIGPNREFTFADYAKAIREIGPEHCILSSDLGQAANPMHPDGLMAFFAGLEAGGDHAGGDRPDVEDQSGGGTGSQIGELRSRV